ncbi:Calcium-activated SK potassium channel [Necator americanus]|uniref:Calcium-activated SK potassium channel n=1 Tax=Necator americanus TaxID=51031 RepID=W2T3B9_NECAM|nr:Calcium-activated SK potassium channel [Necator americanus]ETN76388.1 Calcium-activated SK potassium channel [Necator americanus]
MVIKMSRSFDSTAKMRCRLRKQLFVQRNKVCDLSLILGIAGLLFVIIDAELTALSTTTHITKVTVRVKIALIDSGADDWRVAVSMDRVIKLSVELAICADLAAYDGHSYRQKLA